MDHPFSTSLAGMYINFQMLLVDLQSMIGGKHKAGIDPEEYIFAALNIYLDIINLLFYLLLIIKSC